jgi:urate oxidase
MAVRLGHNQTLYAMAAAVLDGRPEVVEVRLSIPDKHHFLVDLSPFGLANDNEVCHADDRPYGLIEAAVLADGAPDPGPAWDPYPML